MDKASIVAFFVGLLLLFRRKPPAPPNPPIPQAIVQRYRSFGQTLEDGWEADRQLFLDLRAQREMLPSAPVPPLYDPAQDAREQGVGE